MKLLLPLLLICSISYGQSLPKLSDLSDNIMPIWTSSTEKDVNLVPTGKLDTIKGYAILNEGSFTAKVLMLEPAYQVREEHKIQSDNLISHKVEGYYFPIEYMVLKPKHGVGAYFNSDGEYVPVGMDTLWLKPNKLLAFYPIKN